MDGESQKQRMLAGELYSAQDPELIEARRRARRACREYNASSESDPALRTRLLGSLLGACGPRIEVEPPFFCDYGFNIRAADNLYMNFGCVILDCARVTLGRNVLLGPGVHIYAATHPLEASVRAGGLELARPVTIGDDVWIGGGAIICPGVEIGGRSVIGAGSVVTRSIPAGSLAVGNPCRVQRSIEPA